MATERYTSSSTAALPRGHQGTPFESIRERLLAGLAVTERRLSLNGVTTAVLEGGEGAPVVLLHGPGAYAAHWLRIIPNLAATHRVIAPDLPGHASGVDTIERRRCRSRKKPASAFDGISASSTTPLTTRHWSSRRRS